MEETAGHILREEECGPCPASQTQAEPSDTGSDKCLRPHHPGMPTLR
jgi:hypothetical protein